jgi:hypothetical protein
MRCNKREQKREEKSVRVTEPMHIDAQSIRDMLIHMPDKVRLGWVANDLGFTVLKAGV